MSRKALGRGLSALIPETTETQSDLLDIQIDLLDPSPTQPRSSFKPEALNDLAASIRARGIIQPLVVRRRAGRFQIVAGERRWRAAQRAGLQAVPCLIKDIPDDSVLEFSLIENIQREELNAIEEANALRRLIDEMGVTQEDVARRIGRDRTTITNSLRLLKLPREVQKLVEDDKLSMGHARALLSVEQSERQKALASEVVARSLSVRETERLVKSSPQHNKRSAALSRKVEPEHANIVAAETKLSRRLAAPVKIRRQKKGGMIEIKFSSSEDLARLFDVLLRAAASR